MGEVKNLRDVTTLDDDTVIDGTQDLEIAGDDEPVEVDADVDFPDEDEVDAEHFELEEEKDGEKPQQEEPEVQKAVPLQDTLAHTINNDGIESLEEFIVDTLEAINADREDRAVINKRVTNHLDELEAKGLNKKAVKMAMAYLSLNDKDRQAFDLTYKIVRAACKEPVQVDLFAE